MSIQNNFPALKPTLSLDFANTKELDPRITFTRASTATYYGTQTAVAEQNLVTSSQDFTSAGWVKVRVTVTGDTTLAPDGTTTADTITNTATTGAHEVDISAGAVIVSGLTYTISFFAKKNTNDFFQISTFNASNTLGTGRANFNLATGVTGSVDGGTSTITDAGNGWYRCTYTVTASASGSVNIYAVIVTSSTAARFESYTGLGTESVYLWGAQLEQRSAVTAYTPTTTQSITNYIPVLETAASGVARFDHSPTTFESLGLLIEESRTNTFTNSNIPTSLPGNEITLSSAFPALDPTQTFTLGQETTANAEHYFPDRSFTPVVGTTYAFSVYAKQGPGTRNLTLRIAGGNIGATFLNLTTGSVVSFSGVVSSATITPVGNGVYRCTAIWTATSATSTVVRIKLITSAGVTIYAGDGYSGISVWGAQLEVGAFATSYIPTVASQVTRAADAPSITGTNFSSWYNAAEGSLYAEGSSYKSSGSAPIFVLQVAGGDFRHQLALYTSTASTVVAGVTQASIGTNTVATAKNAYAYKVNDFAAVSNAGTVATDTSGVVPTSLTYATIGRFDFGGAASLSGTIKKIAYYPIRLTNAQLQALTS